MASKQYVKTEKGRREIDTRADGLPARMRRLLLMIDGQKTIADLMAQTGLSLELDSLLAELLDKGYIAIVGAASEPLQLETPAPPVLPRAPEQLAVVPPTQVAAPAPESVAATGFEPVSAKELAECRQIMLDSANAFLGLMGADVVKRIQAADTEDKLRACLTRWHLSMRESRNGRAVAEPLFQKVRTILHAENE